MKKIRRTVLAVALLISVISCFLLPAPAAAYAAGTDTASVQETGKITLNADKLVLGVGEAFLIKAELPEGDKIAYLSSTNSDVVTAEKGKITAVSEGTASVWVKSAGGLSAKCRVTVKAAPDSVKLNTSSITIGVGESFDFYCKLPEGTASNKIRYYAGNSDILSVNGRTITGKAAGTTNVAVVLYNGVTAKCKVTVKNEPTSVSLNAASITLGVGEKFKLTSTVPEGTASHIREYIPVNSSVINLNGSTIEAKATGSAAVKVKLYNGVTAKCSITVKSAPASASVEPKVLNIGVGESFKLDTVLPAGTASNIKKYTVSNSSILSVKGSTVTGKSVGSTKAIVTLYNGVTANCTVNVSKAPSSAVLSASDITIGVGETYRFYVFPDDGAASYSKKFYVGNKEILSLNGSTVKGLKSGTTTVAVKLYNGVTARCRVTVKNAPDSASLNVSSLTLGVGETFPLKVTLPQNTASNTKQFSLSNTSVLSISNGTITAKAAGSCDVTVKLYNGVTAKCSVTVMKAPSSVSLDTSKLAISVGEKHSFSCILPEGTAARGRSYSISDSSVIGITGNTIIGKAPGYATVTVRLYNGVTASCSVTVGTPKKIFIDDDLAVLDVGNTVKIVTKTSSGTVTSGLTYTSADKNVATVDANGKVKAVGAGTTEITVSTFGSTAKFSVVVYGSKNGAEFPNVDDSDNFLNSAVLHPMKTNCTMLDDLAASILASLTTPNMTTAQKVRAVYDYLASTSTYGYSYLNVNLPGNYNNYDDYWIVVMSYSMLKTKVGTCENFSSALTVLLRRIGLEANVVYGLVGLRAGGKGGHYWTEVIVNNKHRVFDAQVENNNLGYNRYVNHYWYGMKPELNYRSYEYKRLLRVADFSYS